MVLNVNSISNINKGISEVLNFMGLSRGKNRKWYKDDLLHRDMIGMVVKCVTT